MSLRLCVVGCGSNPDRNPGAHWYARAYRYTQGYSYPDNDTHPHADAYIHTVSECYPKTHLHPTARRHRVPNGLMKGSGRSVVKLSL